MKKETMLKHAVHAFENKDTKEIVEILGSGKEIEKRFDQNVWKRMSKSSFAKWRWMWQQFEIHFNISQLV